MRPLSSSPLSSSSVPPTSSVSFFERYEKMFNGCGGCVADDEQEPVASAIYQQSSCETDVQQQSTQPNEAISNYWSSSNNQARRRHHQESAPPVETTVLLNQASFDESDKFDIEERTSKRQQSKTKAVQTKVKAHTEATAMNEYCTGIRKSHQPEIQMTIQRSPTTTMMTQQQRRRQQQQHCHATTPIKSNTTSTRKSTCSSSSPKSTKRLHYDMLKDMLLANNYNYRSSKGNNRYLHSSNSLTQTGSDLTQSTQSFSESEDDLSWDPIDEEQQPPQEQEQQDTLVSILRRKVKFGTDTKTKTNATDDKKNRVHFRFEQDTQFPDPNERPSSTRKHVPRMSQRQKQEYDRMNNNNTYPRRRRSAQHQHQPNVSSLLIQLFLQHRPL